MHLRRGALVLRRVTENTRLALRADARCEAAHVRQYGWRPRKHDLDRLRKSVRDAQAYRTLFRAWRFNGFSTVAIRKLANRFPKPLRHYAANAGADFNDGINGISKGKHHMPNDLTTTDGWQDVAADLRSQIFRGPLIKFADWQWTIGKEATPIGKGTQFIVEGAAAAWVKWANGKPAEYRLREPGKCMPLRDELGDLDQSRWELGPDNKPRDPFQDSRFAYLVSTNTAECFTFSTSSWGGREAVAKLGDAIARMRSVYPSAAPIVELEGAAMPTKYGRKSKPVFKIVTWKGVNGGAVKKLSHSFDDNTFVA
jgi:hypothetical protein